MGQANCQHEKHLPIRTHRHPEQRESAQSSRSARRARMARSHENRAVRREIMANYARIRLKLSLKAHFSVFQSSESSEIAGPRPEQPPRHRSPGPTVEFRPRDASYRLAVLNPTNRPLARAQPKRYNSSAQQLTPGLISLNSLFSHFSKSEEGKTRPPKADRRSFSVDEKAKSLISLIYLFYLDFSLLSHSLV